MESLFLSSMPTRFKSRTLLIMTALLALPAPALANPSDRENPDSEQEALELIQEPFHTDLPAPADADEPAGREIAVPGEDQCDWDFSSPEVQEDTQEFLRSVSCHGFRWFDGLFGEDIDFPEQEISGLVLLGADWTEYEGFDAKARFRVRAPLPNLDNRWNLIVGRGDEDAFISDTQSQDETFYNPGLINRGGDDSLLLGLGHRRKEGRQGWDWSVGLKVRSKPVPYVRARWYYYKKYTVDTDLRFRQTFFWRSDDGFGSTTRGDLATAFNPTNVMRWEAVITASEATEGAEWFVGQTWYHIMGDRRAFSLLAFADGESDSDVGLREVGFNFIWRQRFTRDWIWISYGPSVTWPRFFKEETREMSLGFGTWIEMEFGNWRY